MLFFVMSENVLQMIVGWELVGVCSFALIGHWWEEKPNSDAALKAFLTNRVGDMGLLIGMIILFLGRRLLEHHRHQHPGGRRPDQPQHAAHRARVSHRGGHVEVGPVHPPHLAPRRHGRAHPGVGADPRCHHGGRRRLHGRSAVPGVLRGAMSIAGSSFNVLALVGAVTLVVRRPAWPSSRTTSRRCWRIRRCPSSATWSWPSASGAWTAAVFHLFTHAFFKAGLFLGSGSVAHSVHSFDMKKDMGGMRKFMPTTKWTFIICSLALAGIPPAGGLLVQGRDPRRHRRLGSLRRHRRQRYLHLRAASWASSAPHSTGAYMTRCIYLTFYGEWRGGAMHHDDDGMTRPTPRTTTTMRTPTSRDGRARGSWCRSTSSVGWPSRRPAQPAPGVHHRGRGELAGAHSVTTSSRPPRTSRSITHGTPSYSLAIFASWSGSSASPRRTTTTSSRSRRQSPASHRAPQRPDDARNPLAKAGHTLLVNKYYLDHLYTDVIVRGTKGPLAEGHVLGQPERHRRGRRHGRRVRRAGRHVRLRQDRPEVSSTASSTAPVSPSEAPCGELPQDADRQGAAVRRASCSPPQRFSLASSSCFV